jgi:hypothetical protein
LVSARHGWMLWFVVTLFGGVCLLYAGVHLAAHSAWHVLDRRFFGLSPRLVLAVDDYIIWGIVALITGLLVGAILRSRPIAAALTTCGVSVIAFAISALYEGLPLRETLVLYAEPFISSLVFVTLGAVLAVRMMRPRNR